ncbi:MAG TPA: CDP-alcohol phosphatidyltransferase family protein [Allosphingosinicella sp.]|jgi:phosphatidylglycerophosphate synthase
MVATTAGQSSASGGGRPRAAATKPRELEDFLNRRIFHPLSRRLAAALASTSVSPNMVSVTGGILVLVAGALYSFADPVWGVAAGFGLHMLWHVVDGADGDLARMTGRASPFGEMVDGACDYFSHALIYLFLAMHLDDWIGVWAYVLGWAAGLSRVAQANHSESQRRIYMWRTYGVPWVQQAQASDDALFRETGGVAILARLTRAYLWLARTLTPSCPELDRAATQASRDPATRRRLTGLCRRAFRLPLFLQTLLGPNSRTLLLGASMALGSPLYYFLAEITLYNLLLIASVTLQKSRGHSVARRLGG